MITEIVTFIATARRQLHEKMAISNFEKTAPTWRENPDLIRKKLGSC